MSFQIETSTRPGAIGAGAPPAKFVDYTHKISLENGVTGDTAEALATFGDGPELVDLRNWAERAHGLDIVAVEPFDAKAEKKRRDSAAKALAADLAAAESEAERIVLRAHQAAAEILADARAEADELIAEASRTLADARDEAADLEALASGLDAGEPAEGEAATGATHGDGEGAEAAGEDESGNGNKRRRK